MTQLRQNKCSLLLGWPKSSSHLWSDCSQSAEVCKLGHLLCLLTLAPPVMCLHPGVLKGTCTGIGNVPYLPTPTCFTLHPQPPWLSLTRAPIFHLVYFRPCSCYLGQIWEPVFAFAPVSAPTPYGTLKNGKRTALYT